MRKARLPMMMILVLAGAASADADGPPKGLAGLVTPAQVASGPPDCVRVDTARKLELRSRPGADAPGIGWLTFAPWREPSGECDAVLPRFEAAGGSVGQPIPPFESDPEVLALAVLERRGEWLLIDLGKQAGWLQQPPGYRFDPYPALVVGRLAHATPAWQGELCAEAGKSCRSVATSADQPLNVLSVTVVQGEAWLEVETITDPCTNAESVARHRGWMRAAAQGRPTAWFYSRGC